MKRSSYCLFQICIVCLSIIIFSSCSKMHLRSQLKDLMGSTVSLPDNISCIYNGMVFPMPDSLRHKRMLLIYVDSTECTTCYLSRIDGYQGLFTMARNNDIEVILLLANQQFGVTPLIRYVSDIDLKIPVYVDVDNCFSIKNPTVPADPRMHSFLLDSLMHPIYVGNPTASDKLFAVFEQTINQI